MNSWTGALIALSGVILGALLAHFSTSRLARKQRQWEMIKQKQNKLEELSTVLDQYENSYRKVSGCALQKIHNNTPMESFGEKIPTVKLNTLVSFYAPEMKPAMKELDSLADEYGVVLAKVITCQKLSSEEKKELMGEVLIGHSKIEKKCQDLAAIAANIVERSIEAESSNKPHKNSAANGAS